MKSLGDIQEKDLKVYWELIKELESTVTNKANPIKNISPRQWFSHFSRIMSKITKGLYIGSALFPNCVNKICLKQCTRT